MALAPRGQPPSPSSDERLPLSTVSLSLRSENVAVVGDEELRRSGGGGDGDDGLRRGCDDGSTASMLGRLPASDAAIGAGFASVLARLMLASKVSEALALLSRLLQLKDAATERERFIERTMNIWRLHQREILHHQIGQNLIAFLVLTTRNGA
jgi:hypothetical protein